MSINLTYKTTEKKIKHYQLFNVCKTSSFLLQAKKVSFSFSKSESFLESRGEFKYLHFLYTVKQKKYFQKITIYPQTKHSNKRNAKSFNFMQFESCPHAITNCIFYSTSGLSG